MVNSGQIADLLPSTVFDSSQPDNTVEFCEGICIFSSTPIVDLRFHNTGPDMLQLMFQHADPTPFINPPATLAEWGPHFESYYRVPNDVPLAILHTGVLTEAPWRFGICFPVDIELIGRAKGLVAGSKAGARIGALRGAHNLSRTAALPAPGRPLDRWWQCPPVRSIKRAVQRRCHAVCPDCGPDSAKLPRHPCRSSGSGWGPRITAQAPWGRGYRRDIFARGRSCWLLTRCDSHRRRTGSSV